MFLQWDVLNVQTIVANEAYIGICAHVCTTTDIKLDEYKSIGNCLETLSQVKSSQFYVCGP